LISEDNGKGALQVSLHHLKIDSVLKLLHESPLHLNQGVQERDNYLLRFREFDVAEFIGVDVLYYFVPFSETVP
jgi:hypothetical protein